MPSSTMTSTSAFGIRTSISEGDGILGRPLQICEIDFEDDIVKVCHDNLAQIEKNLQIYKEDVLKTENLKVCVISVMGMYRTGKSFLLDLLMRYLKAKGSITNFDSSLQWKMGENTYGVDSYNWLLGSDAEDAGADGKGNTASGKVEKVRISEGQNMDNERGFHWRPGIEKCTKGMWLWSKPFVIDQQVVDEESGETKVEPLAVLICDTQGAWDSQMSSEHSACIFGITSLLSSKLIYNLQNRISEEKIDNLDYFTTFANLVVQEMREHKARIEQTEGKKPQQNPLLNDDEEDDDDDGLGDLHFLVRDWEYFEDGWSLEQCTQQVTDHLMTHLDPAQVTVTERRETIDRLHNLFRSVNLCCLPHPGPKIPKTTWRGNVTDIDSDFLYLLTHFLANLSHGEHPLKVTNVFGQDLTSSNFCRTISELVDAFKNAKPDAVNLRQAFVNCESFRTKEDAVQKFNKEVDNLVSSQGLREPEELTELIESLKKSHMEKFEHRLKPLFPGKFEWEIEAKNALMQSVKESFDSKSIALISRNSQMYNQVTLKMLAGPTVVLPIGAAVWSLPHILLYGAAGAGAVVHVHNRAGEKGVSGWLEPDTISTVSTDVQTFVKGRIEDIKGMQVILQEGPEKLPNKIMQVFSSPEIIGKVQNVKNGISNTKQQFVEEVE